MSFRRFSLADCPSVPVTSHLSYYQLLCASPVASAVFSESSFRIALWGLPSLLTQCLRLSSGFLLHQHERQTHCPLQSFSSIDSAVIQCYCGIEHSPHCSLSVTLVFTVSLVVSHTATSGLFTKCLLLCWKLLTNFKGISLCCYLTQDLFLHHCPELSM